MKKTTLLRNEDLLQKCNKLGEIKKQHPERASCTEAAKIHPLFIYTAINSRTVQTMKCTTVLLLYDMI